MLLGKFQLGNKILQKVKILASDALEAAVILFYHSLWKNSCAITLKGLEKSHHSLAVSVYLFQWTFISVGFPDVYLLWLWWHGGAACVFLCKNFSCNMIFNSDSVWISMIFPALRHRNASDAFGVCFKGDLRRRFLKSLQMKQTRQWRRICTWNSTSAWYRYFSHIKANDLPSNFFWQQSTLNFL